MNWRIHSVAIAATAAIAAAAVVGANQEEFDDAKTRRSTVTITSGQIQGIFTERLRSSGDGPLNLVFLFSQEPVYGLTYFTYYDSLEKAIVIDFFDTRIGESLLDPVKEFPIRGSSIEHLRIDMNKNIEGLHPDWRDMVRIRLYCDYAVPVKLYQDDFNMVNLLVEWEPDIPRVATPNHEKSLLWKIHMAVLLMGGIGMGSSLLYTQNLD